MASPEPNGPRGRLHESRMRHHAIPELPAAKLAIEPIQNGAKNASPRRP
jgi:hypothetical protein